MSIEISAAAAEAAETANSALDERVSALLDRMTVTEKIGQMTQTDAAEVTDAGALCAAIRAGRIGSVLNEVDPAAVNELQRVAVRESRLGIPLLTGRDVIHGFRTVLPIPLGQAAAFNPELVRQGARIAALEAAAAGVNWTFAPMIDVSRDPRWGRIAESFGEDVYLTCVLGVAMIRGFQGDSLADAGTIAACAKHFAGYGASESGRDYNSTNIPENELRNVYLPPFKAAVDAGVASIMASFGDLNGVPTSGNRFLMTEILRDEWQYDGFVVSDWGSIEQLTVHGFAADECQAAYEAVNAGVNMEMASTTYASHLADLLQQGRIDMRQLDAMAGDILRCKFRLGLFEDPFTDPAAYPASANSEHLQTATELARQTLVLLRNENNALPLETNALRSLAVIGPLADAPYEQLGTWIFDGDSSISQTPLAAIREFVADGVDIHYVRAMENSRSRSTQDFAAAQEAASACDAVVVFLGEESILSGEAHCRADIDLPGNQADLVHVLHETGKPLIGVILAGRPLTLGNVVDKLDAILYAWHPGTMGGPAIAEILFGAESPSGKLPVTFPGMVGQVPIYYAHKNSGKPPSAESFVHIDDIEVNARQASFGMASFHLDAGFSPLYPFGFGLSYTNFSYSDIAVSHARIKANEALTVQAVVSNDGDVAADEIAQLYVHDRVGNVTRPVRELKGFQRVRLEPGESRTVSFELRAEELAFHGRDMQLMIEPGEFDVWIGGSSTADLHAAFRIVDH